MKSTVKYNLVVYCQEIYNSFIKALVTGKKARLVEFLLFHSEYKTILYSIIDWFFFAFVCCLIKIDNPWGGYQNELCI